MKLQGRNAEISHRAHPPLLHLSDQQVCISQNYSQTKSATPSEIYNYYKHEIAQKVTHKMHSAELYYH